MFFFFFFQAEDGIRDLYVTGVQTCALPIWLSPAGHLHHERSEPAGRPSSMPVRAIWLCRHAAGDPGFLAAPGDRLVPRPGQLNGTAAKLRRPGRASRTSPRAAIAVAPDGGPRRRGNF